MHIDNNWPYTSYSLLFSHFSLHIYEIHDIDDIHDIYDISDIYDSVCLLLVSFGQSIPPEFLQSFSILWIFKKAPSLGTTVNTSDTFGTVSVS